MTQKYVVEPDIGFINEVVGLGGDTLKKCFQCATCSVACPISPEEKPFPRKEMIAASWGLKDKLVGSSDIWLCHQCGDCSTMCPRGAAPGDVLGAIRSYAITEYAQPKFLGKMVNDPSKLGILTAVPAAIFAFFAFLTVFGHGFFAKIFGGEMWYHTHDGLPVPGIAASNFISSWFVDIVFVPLALAVVIVFGLGLKRFIADMHANAILEGKTRRTDLDWVEYAKAIWQVLPTIGKHKKFSECGENRERATAHMMVLFSFIGLAIVTGLVFIGVYFMHQATPYSQLNPIKWVANVSGVALIIGIALMMKNRLARKDQKSAYKDWYILGVIMVVAVTGMFTQMFRLGGVAFLSYLSYYIHLIAIFHLFAYLPFSKMAHLVYRTAAMGYQAYSGRK
ncbi:putative adenylylsulfate reductase-associated electron transfer protein QmoC [Desulfobotulus alkaliphilus]|uniref:Putative adenylylsulfate reductase-associated electron transfer protein QmoC n=1 Tax=Desulfobotulus alkaliphilus TaxID=622671 RepID=A0A562RAV4_9BACT|nr:quinone-interacting membrane-bound oxidoreductase complex subunit QmoC [Desulfobotulus alkaliphilus]TWI66023.1 putative adenylylsulfate reductase-associated electron transfer protein QmoC [Desulfobotulus alkaliphilus]